MRILSAIALIFYVTLAQAAPVEVENIRIWAAPDNTRVVLDVSAPVAHRLETLSHPSRVVLDLSNARLNKAPTQPQSNDRFLQQVRSGMRNQDDLRIVLDLKQYSDSKSFLLPPNKHYGHRLVIDLFNKQAEEEEEIKQAAINPLPDRTRDVIVAIDAGHGGEDPGAMGPSGTREKDIVLDISRQLAQMVNNERGMRALLVRQGDYYLPLRKRMEKAREHKADLFISIHADAFRDPRVSGSSVYILSQRGASSEAARWLAEQENASDLVGGVSLDVNDNILASVLLDLSQTASLEASIDVADRVLSGLKSVGKVHKRHVQSAGFAVLKSPDIPSILIETAYISNPREEKNLRNNHFQEKLAGAILTGLRGYFSEHAPEGTLLASTRKARKHVISRGDTLSAIAQQYSVSMQKLREKNGLKTDIIRVGQVLDIPNDG
ncbi:MAG TPA: N-acetylmuramoyl-L-alanine amidase [Gammaproteobacteria bacterium]|nr:N-acetylmuramoyl-L-alanine amidase [Gammaproteobacteria bacterium]